MKKFFGKLLLFLISLIVLCLAVFCVIYYTRFQTMSTIEKLTDYEDGFNLYSMTVKYDYSVQDIIDSGFTDTQGFVDAVMKQSLPLLPAKMELPSFGCSVYRAQNDRGETIMGRNYDFKLDTSCMLLYCEPKDGYKSLSFVALNNDGVKNANGSILARLACLSSPFSCLDGVNEKGVSIAVLTLDSEPTDQNTGREKITSSLAIRLVLDNAATTQEAVDIIKSYDMLAVNGRDYHLFVSDASGDSRVIEYDCEDPERAAVDTPIQAVTNFYGMYIDKVESNQKNGIYGHGKERYDRIMDIIEPNNGILTEKNAWAALEAASSKPNPESVTSNTQWSVIFNNTNPSADIVIRRNWGDIFSFELAD